MGSRENGWGWGAEALPPTGAEQRFVVRVGHVPRDGGAGGERGFGNPQALLSLNPTLMLAGSPLLLPASRPHLILRRAGGEENLTGVKELRVGIGEGQRAALRQLGGQLLPLHVQSFLLRRRNPRQAEDAEPGAGPGPPCLAAPGEGAEAGQSLKPVGQERMQPGRTWRHGGQPGVRGPGPTVTAHASWAPAPSLALSPLRALTQSVLTPHCADEDPEAWGHKVGSTE